MRCKTSCPLQPMSDFGQVLEGNDDGSDDLLYRGWPNIRGSGASAFVADFTGLARGNRRLDSTNVGELDWSRRHGSLELFRIAPRYASLIGRLPNRTTQSRHDLPFGSRRQ